MALREQIKVLEGMLMDKDKENLELRERIKVLEFISKDRSKGARVGSAERGAENGADPKREERMSLQDVFNVAGEEYVDTVGKLPNADKVKNEVWKGVGFRYALFWQLNSEITDVVCCRILSMVQGQKTWILSGLSYPMPAPTSRPRTRCGKRRLNANVCFTCFVGAYEVTGVVRCRIVILCS